MGDPHNEACFMISTCKSTYIYIYICIRSGPILGPPLRWNPKHEPNTDFAHNPAVFRNR